MYSKVFILLYNKLYKLYNYKLYNKNQVYLI